METGCWEIWIDDLDGELVMRKTGRAERKIEVIELDAVIAHINAIQNKLSGFQTNSSSMFEPLREAWNLNAKVLNEFSIAQSRYLDSDMESK